MPARLPPWFKQRLPDPEAMAPIERLLGELHLHTICESAVCPNIGECFSRGTATFLILGDICTRRCTFCAVKKGKPLPLDAAEPRHLLEAVQKLDLSYVVITSVTRDDLSDGGATQFATAIKLIHERRSNTRVEVLIPDFRGSLEALRIVIRAGPEVINHNVETVPRFYPEVRPDADYARSLEIFARVKEQNRKIVTKSGLMVGLGETKDEIVAVMQDLRSANCDLLTIGQYLSPSATHHPALRYVTPDEFSELAEIGRSLGFAAVAAAPLVRSSFRAAELYSRVSSSERLAKRS